MLDSNSQSSANNEATRLDAVDRHIILATQTGLPLSPHPYADVADKLGISEQEVIKRMRSMKKSGVIRRIAAVPNHYNLGYRANAMTVWDIDDEQINTLGKIIGELDFVSHAYHRPRHLPEWPYNFFAMVHGRTRDEVAPFIKEIKLLLGSACRSHDVLFSSKILKKQGLRLKDK